TLLVTGDSLSQPLDSELARLLSPKGVKVIRDPHLGSGISKSFLVDWGQLSADQVRKHKPNAIVVMIGANEGYPIEDGKKQVKCCGADWASAYANRARRMLATYRQGGLARIYWITVPATRVPKRAAIANVVDASIAVAAQPWRRQVRVIDSRPIFTPDGYRDAMKINGKETIVRASDGIHLNEPGSKFLAENVLGRINRDFTVGHGSREVASISDRDRAVPRRACFRHRRRVGRHVFGAEVPRLGLLHVDEGHARELRDRQEGHAGSLQVPHQARRQGPLRVEGSRLRV